MKRVCSQGPAIHEPRRNGLLRPVLLATLLLPWLGRSAPPPAMESRAERMVDGSILVVLSRPDARTSSLRYVVRSGAEEDPVGREGLAHLLEHALFHGSHDVSGEELRRDVLAAGGSFNAFTSATDTTFVLNAPSEEFLPLADRFLRMVTSPALRTVNLSREKRVVASESDYARTRGGIHALIEQSLIGMRSKVDILGSSKSREATTVDDLVHFFTKKYVTNNTALVLAGNVSWEDGLQMVRRSIRLPPALETEAPLVLQRRLQIPVSRQSTAPFSLTALGYVLKEVDQPYCSFVAGLLQLRMMLDFHVRQPLSSEMGVQCLRLQEENLLLAMVYSRSVDASTLPDRVREAFHGLAQRGPTARERALLGSRFVREVELLQEDEPMRASLVAQLLAGGEDVGSVLAALRIPAQPHQAKLRAMVQGSFTLEREVSITFTPFQADLTDTVRYRRRAGW